MISLGKVHTKSADPQAIEQDCSDLSVTVLNHCDRSQNFDAENSIFSFNLGIAYIECQSKQLSQFKFIKVANDGHFAEIDVRNCKKSHQIACTI